MTPYEILCFNKDVWLSWWDLRPTTNEEHKWTNKGYVGLTCSNISTFEGEKIREWLALSEYADRIKTNFTSYADTDLKSINVCNSMFFPNPSIKDNFIEFLKTLPKRIYRLNVRNRVRDLRSHVYTTDLTEEMINWLRENTQYPYHYFDSSLGFIATFTNEEDAAYFKLIYFDLL
jgi:hypothetical protein